MEDNFCLGCGEPFPAQGLGQVCPTCLRRATYLNLDCPECGHRLEVKAEWLDYCHMGPTGLINEGRTLIRHCPNCHLDWKNRWHMKFGNAEESINLERHFWG